MFVRYDNSLGIYPPASVLGAGAALRVRAPSSGAPRGWSWTSYNALFVTTAECGLSDGRRLVLCLGPTLTLSPEDQLQVLAFVTPGAVAFVRSERVEGYLRTVLGQLPGRADFAQFADSKLTQCEYTCERVIVLQKGILANTGASVGAP